MFFMLVLNVIDLSNENRNKDLVVFSIVWFYCGAQRPESDSLSRQVAEYLSPRVTPELS